MHRQYVLHEFDDRDIEQTNPDIISTCRAHAIKYAKL